MGFLYKKEIVEGVKSSRKILGIPIYQRTDTDIAVTKKYFFGLWKTELFPDKKRYYLFGKCIGEKRNDFYAQMQSLCEENKKLKILMDKQEYILRDYETKLNQLNSLPGIEEQINIIRQEVHSCWAESANLKNLIQCQELHKKTFGPYKNAFRGQTVVLVASGPTSKYYRGIEGAVHVGVNNACLLEQVKFDYLFCQDFYMDEEKRKIIVQYRKGECKKFFGRIPENRMRACKETAVAAHVRRCPRYFVEEAAASEYYIYDLLQDDRIAYDIENEPLLPDGVAFAAFQFILHTHPKKIYLVGCDCSSGFFYESEVSFDNSYMIKTWESLKEYADLLYPDIEIYSLNPVGLTGLFEDKFTSEYLENKRYGG